MVNRESWQFQSIHDCMCLPINVENFSSEKYEHNEIASFFLCLKNEARKYWIIC